MLRDIRYYDVRYLQRYVNILMIEELLGYRNRLEVRINV